MQRLLAKHKAELQAEREKAQDSTRFDRCIDRSLYRSILHTCLGGKSALGHSMF